MSENTAESQRRSIVNQASLKDCVLRCMGRDLRILDISYLRVVAEEPSEELPPITEPVIGEFIFHRQRFQTSLLFKSRGTYHVPPEASDSAQAESPTASEEKTESSVEIPSEWKWIRFNFEKLLPSAQAHLRSFLSPKKIGESILLDAAGGGVHHYHGLNECELWADEKGGILFTYLDPQDARVQFIVRVPDKDSSVRVGRIPRDEYMNLKDLDGELVLGPLSDREIYSELGACRDILTNFRPSGQTECQLKQRLLKLVSETLYSTSHRVDMTIPRPPKVIRSVDGVSLS